MTREDHIIRETTISGTEGVLEKEVLECHNTLRACMVPIRSGFQYCPFCGIGLHPS